MDFVLLPLSETVVNICNGHFIYTRTTVHLIQKVYHCTASIESVHCQVVQLVAAPLYLQILQHWQIRADNFQLHNLKGMFDYYTTLLTNVKLISWLEFLISS